MGFDTLSGDVTWSIAKCLPTYTAGVKMMNLIGPLPLKAEKSQASLGRPGFPLQLLLRPSVQAVNCPSQLSILTCRQASFSYLICGEVPCG